MAFFNRKKCLIQEDFFLEVTWADGYSPAEQPELLSSIELLDQEVLTDQAYSMEESLPYLTFLQAELLFQEIKERFSQFYIAKVAICHLEGKEAVSDGEVFSSPFVIDEGYQNLLLPLIQAILVDPDFASYSYQEKREYFTDQIFPAYKMSLNLSDAALPLFPTEGEVAATQPRGMKKVVPPVEATGSSAGKQSSLKKVYILGGVAVALASVSLSLNVLSLQNLTKKTEQVNYLHQQLEDVKALQEHENQVDVFNRYFIPAYYSNNKEVLSTFLDKGNAKFTAPKEGAVQSVILEKITYSSGEYTATYVLSLKQNEGTKSIRLTFTVKEEKSSRYGFVVTTEPKEADYIKQ